MIYYNADENFRIIQFTKSKEQAEFYNLTDTTTDDGIEQAYNGEWYLKGHCPTKPHNEEIQEQIAALEAQITDRNIRGAILGDEFAINKLNSIEAQIAELRRQLEGAQ